MFRNSGYYFMALFAGALVAFWPKYISRPPGQIDAYTHVHAAAMVVWCGLLIAQPFLIRGGRARVHRALGAVSYAVVPVLLAASLLLAHLRFRTMDDRTFEAEAANLYLPLSAVVLFGVAYGGGILFRKTPAAHATFMICTALTMVDPVLGRILAFYFPPLPNDLYYQAITFGLVDVILLGLLLTAPGRARSGWVLRTMLVVFVGAHIGWFTAAQSAEWRVFAAWFRRLPLT